MSPILSDLDPDLPACRADACSSGRKPCPCPDACRVVPRQRLGRFHGWERFLIEHPTLVAVGSVVAFALLVWGTKP